jgi:hypothetical protein
MTSRNLVDGGARPGLFQTRRNRLVRITEQFDFSEPPQPGFEPVVRKCWKGLLYMADGYSVDSPHVWENDGAYHNMQGVLSQFDLTLLVEADPVPEKPQAALPKAQAKPAA